MLKIFVVTVALSLSSCPGAIGKALRLWGYTEVRPATTLVEPGTLVEVQAHHPFRVHTLCTAKQMLGDDYVPQASDTQIGDLAKINRSQANLEVDVASIVNSNNVVSGISDVKMKFDNARVFEVTDHDIYSRRHKTSPYCLDLLRDRVRDGFKVTMVASALRADVVYTVKWDKSSKLGIAAKIEALANLSANLSAEASPQTTNTISGKGLYWGIRDDVWLAYRYLEPDAAPPVQKDSRIIPTSLVVTGIKAPAPAAEPVASPTAGAEPPHGDPIFDRHGHGRPSQPVSDTSNATKRTVMSVDTQDGKVTYELPSACPTQDYELIPADPNEDWQDVVLEPVHEL